MSNLEFLDISGNKIGDAQFAAFVDALRQNKTLRLVRCSDNKVGSEAVLQCLEMLSNHSSIIDKLPSDHGHFGDKKSKSSGAQQQYRELREAARQNLRGNKAMFEIDRQMMAALPRDMRLEKELRRSCGAFCCMVHGSWFMV